LIMNMMNEGCTSLLENNDNKIKTCKSSTQMITILPLFIQNQIY
jgi:hypothetical protein